MSTEQGQKGGGGGKETGQKERQSRTFMKHVARSEGNRTAVVGRSRDPRMGSRKPSSAPLLACNLHDGRRRRRAGKARQATDGSSIRTNRAKEPEVAGQTKVKLAAEAGTKGFRRERRSPPWFLRQEWHGSCPKIARLDVSRRLDGWAENDEGASLLKVAIRKQRWWTSSPSAC